MTLTELFRNGLTRNNTTYAVRVLDNGGLPKFSIQPTDGGDETLYFTVDTAFGGDVRLEPWKERA